MSLHSFDPEVASRVGVNAAVIYQNIMFWTAKNLANGRHVHDGCVWTYNSVKAWAELFPYLSADQVRRALARLVEAGMIREGNYNKSAYDRTKWYGVPCQVHLAKTTNGIGENPEPIRDSKPDDKHTHSKECATGAAGSGWWDELVSILSNQGITERRARSLLGKWTKDHGRDKVREAILSAQSAADPMAVVEAALAPKKSIMEQALEIQAARRRKYNA